MARFCVLGHWRPAHCAASMRMCVYNARQNAPWCAHVCNTRQTCITKFICGEKTLDPPPPETLRRREQSRNVTKICE